MAPKTRLRTVRFAPTEWVQVEDYLSQNPIFESFSALARVATLSFVGESNVVRLQPVEAKARKSRPRFLWDYDLNEVQVREILGRPGLSKEKRWLIERILTQARFNEVFDYLDLSSIRLALPHLRLPPKIKKRWTYALERWSTVSHET